jgi:hypothetical protein
VSVRFIHAFIRSKSCVIRRTNIGSYICLENNINILLLLMTATHVALLMTVNLLLLMTATHVDVAGSSI